MMKFRGETRFTALGQDWVLLFDFNALALFEEERGVPALDVIAGLEDEKTPPRITDLRLLLWTGLKRHQPEVTLEQAGDIMSAAPEALLQGINAALPPAPGQGPGKGPGKGKGRARGK
ncbi:hypothetical protein [Chachezhania sediminis]|uniref:hypothetical protein n=1 Tax=Chachezhania sediminis TaxID=2599291 RepID=UPI00131B5BED|nr:hypothetical protein [Chachezhania sediminis]